MGSLWFSFAPQGVLLPKGAKNELNVVGPDRVLPFLSKTLKAWFTGRYVVIWANVTICVRRHLHAALRKASSLKRQQRRRHHGNRPQNFRDPSRQLCKARRICRWRSCLDPRIRDQALLQNLWSWRNVGQISQVRVHANRTHQRDEFWPIGRVRRNKLCLGFRRA